MTVLGIRKLLQCKVRCRDPKVSNVLDILRRYLSAVWVQIERPGRSLVGFAVLGAL
jgi:hypothetical protein